MRKRILWLGISLMIIVTICNFYSNDIYYFIETKVLQKEYVVAKPNEYFVDDSFNYVENFTDDPSNYFELINYVYYIINTGVTYADGECKKSYESCISDLEIIANDQELLSTLNNFVHPYNSFKYIEFTINKKTGRFSFTIEHIYNEEEINEINSFVNTFIEENITDDMDTVSKIKKIHDYIIDNTQYDIAKSEDINNDTYKSNTAYGVLFQHYGICSGYSDAMSIFLHKLDIKNYKISNDTHIWNLVNINGTWRHLDLTWDDPISKLNVNRQAYFLISTKELKKLNDDTHSFNIYIFSEAN